MHTKSRFVLVVVVILLVALFAARLVLFSEVDIQPYPTRTPLEVALSETILRHKAGEIPVVDLSVITTFSWDRVYIFDPYSNLSEIDAVVGRSWRGRCFTSIETSDSYALLVFVKNGQYVECLEHPVGKGNFSSLARHESGFSVQEAKFRIDEYGRMIWIESK